MSIQADFPSDFFIRRAAESDAPGILHCLASAFEPFRLQYTAGAFDDTVLTLETLGERLSATRIFVAKAASGGIIGTIACSAIDSEEGHIRGMAVDPDWQGRGVAEALLRAAETALVESKCSRVSLDTTAVLQRAIRFYEKNGFRASGKVTDFFGMPLYEYVKPLDPPVQPLPERP